MSSSVAHLRPSTRAIVAQFLGLVALLVVLWAVEHPVLTLSGAAGLGTVLIATRLSRRFSGRWHGRRRLPKRAG